jgi:hypothetical protein
LAGRKASRKAGRQERGHIGRRVGRQAGREEDRNAARQTDRGTERQMYTYTYSTHKNQVKILTYKIVCDTYPFYVPNGQIGPLFTVSIYLATVL